MYLNRKFLSISKIGVGGMWMFAIVCISFVFICSINTLSSVAGQTTTLTRSCISDPLEPGRSILEITGDNYTSISFNINSVIDNCHVNIHDFQVASVVFSSQIINNSNITIRNVSSSDKSVATFISFSNTISNFSFINISNISHSSLSIGTSTINDWISIVKFNGAITGKADMSSWIFIADLQMNDVVCDRTPVGETECSSAIVYFGSSITNASSLNMKNFVMSNISLNCSSSTNFFAAYSAHFQAVVSMVQTILVEKFTTRNVRLRNDLSSCEWILLKLNAPVAAMPQSMIVPSSFTLRDVAVDNITSSTVVLASQVRVFFASGKISNFFSVTFANIHAAGLHSTSANADSVVFVLHLTDAIEGPTETNSSLVFHNITLQRVSSSGGTTSQVFLLFMGKVTNYYSIRMTSIVGRELTATGTSTAVVQLLSLSSDLVGPASFSSVEEPSLLLLENIHLELVSSRAVNSAQIYVLDVGGVVENYHTLKVANVTAVSLRGTSSSVSTMYCLHFSLDVTAPNSPSSSSSSSSLLHFDNIRLENASSEGAVFAPFYFVYFGAGVVNYNHVLIQNLVVLSLNSTSSSGMSYLYLVQFVSSVTAPIANSPNSLSPSWLLVDGVRLENATSIGRTDSNLRIFHISWTISNFHKIQLKNIHAKNVFTASSTSAAPVNGIFFTGIIDCSFLEVDNIQMHNTSSLTANALYKAEISLLTLGGSTYINMVQLLLQNSVMEDISISSLSQSVVRIFDAGSALIVTESEIIFNHNSLVLYSSSGIVTSTSQSISAATLSCAVASPGFRKMEMTNNILKIVGPHWQQACAPARCSLVRISDVKQRSSADINQSAISMLSNDVDSAKASCISFALYGLANNPLNTDDVAAKFLLENNKFNFSNADSAQSLLGFDFPPPSLPLPPSVFIDVKCNEWPRVIDLALEAKLISAVSSASKVHNFIQWTCQTPSETATASMTSTITTSLSESASADASWTMSRSIKRTSVSPIPTETKSSDLSMSRSSSLTESATKIATLSNATPDVSLSTSSSASPSAIVPPPPYRSPLRPVYEATTAATSVLSVVSLSSSSVLSAVRSRSALRHFDDVLYSNCGLNDEELATREDEKADLSSSPTTMKLSDGGHLTGLVIGNICLIVAVGVAWFVGRLIVPPRGKAEEGHEKDKNENKNDKKRETAAKKKNKKKPKREEKKTSWTEKFVASNAHLMMMLITTLLLEPTLTSSATALLGGFLVEGRSVSLASIVCVILAWFVLLCVGLLWPMWRLVYNRSTRHDEFQKTNKRETDNKSSYKFPLRRFVEWMKSPSGEWEFVGENREHERIRFELAVPFIEPFTPKFPKFIAIDFGILVGLSLAEVIGYIVSSSGSYCFARGIIVCFVLSLHVLCVIVYNPLYTDRMSNTLAVVVEVISIAINAGALSMSSSQDDVAGIDGWSRIAVAQSVMEALVVCLELADAFLPIWDWLVEKMKSIWPSEARSNNASVAMAVVVPDARTVEKQRRDERNDARCKALDEEIALLNEEFTAKPKLETNKKKQKRIKRGHWDLKTRKDLL